jgi:hypothetical protein
MNKKAKAKETDKLVRVFPQDVELARQIGAKLFPGLKVSEVVRLVIRQRAESLGIHISQ